MKTLCALIVLTSVLLPILAVAASASEDKYDFSRPGSGYTSVYDGAYILSEYLGEAVSELEAEHLRREGVMSVKIDTGISSSYVFAEYNDADGTVTVRADKYVYTTRQGSQAEWLPVSIVFDGVEYPLNGENGFTVVLGNVNAEGDLYAEVIYRFECKVSKEDLNTLLTKLYTDASAYSAEISAGEAEYERLLSEYESAVSEHEDYLAAMSEYELKRAEYEVYLSEKSAWEEAYENYLRYTEYLEAVEAMEYYNTVTLPQYNADKEAYEAYVIAYDKWQDDLVKKSRLDAKKDEARRQLGIIDTAFVTMTSLERQIYSSMQSGLIDTVVANKDKLCSKPYNVAEEVVDMADAASRTLRGTDSVPGLLKQYSELTDESAKYDFYINNFEALRDNFTALVQSLDKLYSNNIVRGAIVDNGRNDKFVIFVAQLALVANGLNGDYTPRYEPTGGQPTFNSSYTIDKKTISAILDGYTIDKPTTPVPGENVFLLNIEPVEPEYVTDPGNMPEPPPTPVWSGGEYEDPGEPPVEVAEPVEPAYVSEPGDPPREYLPDPYKKTLADALADGSITERDTSDIDYTLSVTKSVRKKLTNVTRYTVRFFDTDGVTVLCEQQVEEGSAVEYSGEIPTKGEDVRATYVFLGWQDSLGEPFNSAEVNSNLDLFPSFTPVYKKYTVNFSVNGAVFVCEYLYGDTPDFSGETSRADDEYYRYTFSGWTSAAGDFYAPDEELPEVTENTVYTARYDKAQLYTVAFSVGENLYSAKYLYGELPVFEGDTLKADDSLFTYEFTGWRCGSLFVEPDGLFPPVNKPVTYVAEYAKTYIFPISSSGAEVTVERNYISADCTRGGANIDFSVISDYLSAHGGLGLKLKMKLGTVIISPDTLTAMLEAGDTVIGLETVRGAVSKYKVNLYNKDGSIASRRYPLERVEFSYSGDYSNASTHSYEGSVSEENRIYFSYTDGTVGFAASSGEEYIIRNDYTVSIRPSAFGTLAAVNGTLFAEGDEVTVRVSLPAGVLLEGLYFYGYTTAEPCEIAGQGGVYKFSMPAYNISIGAVCSYKQYTITFISGEAVLVSYTHRYGDTVTVPADPIKAGYTFAGWSSEILPVTEDAVYRAVFVPIELPNTDDVKEETIEGRLLYAGTVCYYMIMYVVIPASVLGLSVLAFERRKYLPGKMRRRKK